MTDLGAHTPAGPGAWRRAAGALAGPPTRTVVNWVAAAAVPVAVTVALIPLRSDVPNATTALVLAVVVIVLAATGTRTTAIVAALSAGLAFDVYFTRPYDSLAIAHAEDVEITLLLLAVGVRCTSWPLRCTFLAPRSIVKSAVETTGSSSTDCARRSAARNRARNSFMPNGFVT